MPRHQTRARTGRGIQRDTSLSRPDPCVSAGLQPEGVGSSPVRPAIWLIPFSSSCFSKPACFARKCARSLVFSTCSRVGMQTGYMRAARARRPAPVHRCSRTGDSLARRLGPGPGAHLRRDHKPRRWRRRWNRGVATAVLPGRLKVLSPRRWRRSGRGLRRRSAPDGIRRAPRSTASPPATCGVPYSGRAAVPRPESAREGARASSR